MSGLGTTILGAILGLCSQRASSMSCSVWRRRRGAGHAILGLLFPPYSFFWGWMTGGRLEMLDIMGLWTVITIFSMAFPVLMSGVAITSISIR